MHSIEHPSEKNQSHISPGKNDRQNATVAEVVATALACGYRWVMVGGSRPLLTNMPLANLQKLSTQVQEVQP